MADIIDHGDVEFDEDGVVINSDNEGGDDEAYKKSPLRNFKPVTLEELKEKILKTNKAVLDDDDPILLIHTAHLMFINDFIKLLEAHDHTIKSYMSETGEHVTSEVTAALSSLRDETLRGSIATALAEMDQHHTYINEIYLKIKLATRPSVWVGGLILGVAVLIFGLLASKLYF